MFCKSVFLCEGILPFIEKNLLLALPWTRKLVFVQATSLCLVRSTSLCDPILFIT